MSIDASENGTLRDAWRFGPYERGLLTFGASVMGTIFFQIAFTTVNQHSTPAPYFKSAMKSAYLLYQFAILITFLGRPVAVYAGRFINSQRTGESSNVD